MGYLDNWTYNNIILIIIILIINNNRLINNNNKYQKTYIYINTYFNLTYDNIVILWYNNITWINIKQTYKYKILIYT